MSRHPSSVTSSGAGIAGALPSRRALLQLGVLGAGAATLAACGGSSGGGSSSGTTLWYWGGALSDAVVKEAQKHFASEKLKSSVIGGDFKQKLQTTLAGGRFIPTITGVKGEDMPYFLSVANKFTDLGPLGAEDAAAKGLDWKWKQAQTSDGKQIGYPIDIGPTALYYRQDILGQAGLPTEPDAVAAATSTWDDFFTFGQQLKAKVPSTFPVGSLGAFWGVLLGQASARFVDEKGTFIGDRDEIHEAWNTVVKAQKLGLNANYDQDQAAAWSSGKVSMEFGAAWHAEDIKDGAPKTKGSWRVTAMPVKPTNDGGSFLTIPSATKDAKSAYQIIEWLLSPSNGAEGYRDASIFPADPASWTYPALTGGDAFFGGQKTIDIFSAAAKDVGTQYQGPTDSAVGAPYSEELTKVQTSNKDPDQAWSDAVASAKKAAARQGGS